MKDTQKQPQTNSGNLIDDDDHRLLGIDPETSLLTVNFAPEENSLLNINYHEVLQEE